MNTSRIPLKELRKLLFRISDLLYDNGLKATTMDSVAASLSISKRTLYEIFDNKTDMIASAFDAIGEKHEHEAEEIFHSSNSVLEMLVRILKQHRNHLCRVHPDFFSDMDKFYRNVKPDYAEMQRRRRSKIMDFYTLGCQQGVLRKDINYAAIDSLRGHQMTSIKRTYKEMGEEFSLTELFDVISISFLRAIVSPDRFDELEQLLEKYELNHANFSSSTKEK